MDGAETARGRVGPSRTVRERAVSAEDAAMCGATQLRKSNDTVAGRRDAGGDGMRLSTQIASGYIY